MNPTDIPKRPFALAAGMLAAHSVSPEMPLPDMPCAAAPEKTDCILQGEL